jgi:hypothetical protein
LPRAEAEDAKRMLHKYLIFFVHPQFIGDVFEDAGVAWELVSKTAVSLTENDFKIKYGKEMTGHFEARMIDQDHEDKNTRRVGVLVGFMSDKWSLPK